MIKKTYYSDFMKYSKSFKTEQLFKYKQDEAIKESLKKIVRGMERDRDYSDIKVASYFMDFYSGINDESIIECMNIIAYVQTKINLDIYDVKVKTVKSFKEFCDSEGLEVSIDSFRFFEMYNENYDITTEEQINDMIRIIDSVKILLININMV